VVRAAAVEKKVLDIGKAWAVVRRRITGNRQKASGLLQSMNNHKRREIGKQQARSRIKRPRKAYKLGESVKRRR
jgi:hypothetical protein